MNVYDIYIYTVYIYTHNKVQKFGVTKTFSCFHESSHNSFQLCYHNAQGFPNHHLKKMTFLSDPKFVNGSVYISYDRDIHLFDIDICTSIHLISALLPL